MERGPFAALLVLAALTPLPGCGGGHGWSETQCRGEARQLAVRAESMVRHYRGSTVYPADMSYLGFRDGLVLFDKSGCPPGELGAALRRELDPAGRKTLLRLLPRRISRRVQQALGP